MNRRDFIIGGAGAAAALATAAAAETPAKANLGLLIYSFSLKSKAEKANGFSDPVHFLEFAHERGANAVQLPLGVRNKEEADAVHRACDRLEMRVEGIVLPPKDDHADLERFTAELSTARACGATVVRGVLLGGRRYEVFEKAEDYPAFAKRSEESLRRAEPVARNQKMILAIENHKDFRTDEMIDLLKRISSESIGVCLDTGNNLALLEDPLTVIEALAPFTRSVHLKDMGVEESADGFNMAEVPLGRGIFDLPRMVATVQKASPQAHFHLELITRDPLSIPCLSEKYWATLERVPGRDLARTLAHVRKTARKEPLLRISSLKSDEQLSIEEQQVRESFEYATHVGLVSG